eukprot:NODE_4484_length_1057_cov_78.005353_g4282_i0.p1 GENE.NODE_4484_length_1057_cov_78.005353_g4282_i0~~NODE_4484_length_1057_cov_78.005353_g4282_i0.p1  ORF type:complete len:311 (-),score=21.75 NODE_4484_length_1057_cov_78.005353_g4282_i0:72-1004(-)
MLYLYCLALCAWIAPITMSEVKLPELLNLHGGSSSNVAGDNQLLEMEKQWPCHEFRSHWKSSSKTKPRIAMVTATTQDVWDFYAPAVHTHQCYAQRHGYESIVEPMYEKTPFGAQPHWYKVFVLRKWLPFYDWVVWIDGDVVIKNMDVPLERWIHSDKEMVVSEDSGAVNNGVFMMKNSCWSARFLRVWWQHRWLVTTWPAEDNSAFVHTLLRIFAQYHPEVGYKDQCIPEQRTPGWTDCWNTWTARMGQRLGNRKHPHVRYVYGGFNSGPNWDGPNDYKPGHFVFHTKTIKESGPQGKWRYMCDIPPFA